MARLTPDLTSLALRHKEAPGGGWSRARAVMTLREGAWVEVYGAGRVGAGVAALVAAAGAGSVSVVDASSCRHGDVAPLGLDRSAVGWPREAAAHVRINAVSTAAATPSAPPARIPDLCVLAPDAGASAALAGAWARRAEPHLVAYVRESVGIVGPLVLPGRTACLRCLDLHRRDRDPAWPRVAAQLADDLPRRACDVALATVVAAQCALQVMAYLDGDPVSTLGATLETTADGTRVRRRAWPAHPGCGCQWTAEPGPVAAKPSGRTDPLRSATMTL